MERKCIRINNIKLVPGRVGVDKDIERAVKKQLRLSSAHTLDYELVKRSYDCRRVPDILCVYSVRIYGVKKKGEDIPLTDIIKNCSHKNVSLDKCVIYEFPVKDVHVSDEAMRPVIIGFGPAGMFCALELARAGMRPVVYERGDDVDTRTAKVARFWETGKLDKECNVQFGEGGAGTFSDGKLNTQVTDTYGRIRHVLEEFVSFGADGSIMYAAKPHIGTDVLAGVVKNIRNEIIGLGGEVNFGCLMKSIETENGCVRAVNITKSDGTKLTRECRQVCLAIGHSARDTFKYLFDSDISMQPKPFAVGVRVEHPQRYVNYNSYGVAGYELPAADYKVTYKTEPNEADGGKQRGVYSFCMCPGGYVVNASSEAGGICVNGMSYAARDSLNANAAIIVTVGPEDYGYGVLDGIQFQRELERAAFLEGHGAVPVQTFKDFEDNVATTKLGIFKPNIKGEYRLGNLNNVLPKYISAALVEGVHGFAKSVPFYDDPRILLSGVESRTSSPVRIMRNDGLESESLKGLYPCGEGAGYAGGITSAAIDGIKIAEQIATKIASMCY